MKQILIFAVLMYTWAGIGLLLASAGVPDLLAFILATGILYAIGEGIGKLRN